MAWLPISGNVTQRIDSSGDPATNYVLKLYIAGTTTNTPMATDSTGNTTANYAVYNSTGDITVSGNPIIPHIDRDYKLAVYPDQASADADSGAVLTIDNIKYNAALEGLDIGWQFISDTGYLTLDPAAVTADTTENTHRLAILATNTITIPAGTTPLVSSLYVVEPNISATGTVTTAATVYIKDAPTEGGSNYALWVDSGAVKFDGALDVAGAASFTTIGASSEILVGKSSGDSGATEGTELDGGVSYFTRSGNPAIAVNRLDSYGGMMVFRRDGTTYATLGLPGANRFEIDATTTELTGGLSFDGGTNSLNVYEEGTFTPVIADASSGGNTSPTALTGHYIQIGRLMKVSIKGANISTSGMTGTNGMYLRNLPSAKSATITPDFEIGLVRHNNVTASNDIVARIEQGNSFALFLPSDGGAALAVSTFSSGSADIDVSLSYFVD